MVIYDFHLFCTRICPIEAYSKFIIYADAILPNTVTLECFETIPGWHLQIVETIRDFELANFSSSNLSNVCESFNMVTL